MRIGELAHESGVSARSLRYYEARGLLTSRRESNGYREFGDESIATVRKINSLIRSGVSTEMIEMILPCMPDSTLEIRMCDDIAARLNSVRDYLDAQISDLESSRDAVTLLLTNSASRG